MTSTGDDDWEWTFSKRADEQFSKLDDPTQERIIEKLDEVVSSEWRDPEDFLEPLTNSPFRKLRIGEYRLGCRLVRSNRVLRVESVRPRSGAYTADDD
jgi:mRNA-degrading endonuclease RelE of RelBE toxin-antitoxin system